MKKIILLLLLLPFPSGLVFGVPEVEAIVKSGIPEPRVAAVPDPVRKDFPIDDYIELPPPDLEAVRAEDGLRETRGKGGLRIGFFRELPSPLRLADYPGRGVKTRYGGEARVFVFHSPGAEAIRIEVSGAEIPEGAEFTVFNYLDPAEARGPYGRDYLRGGESFWTESIFSDLVALEFRLPPGVREKAGFRVDRLVHVYDFPSAPAAKQGGAGWCNIDAMCAEEEWRSAANAVAGIGTIGNAGLLWCTGSLLNNSANDFTDYFMTAHHCVENQGQANSTEFYWFYQTPSCDGTPPNPATVPRTSGGADYLASSPYPLGNDFAFLLLREASPGGVTYLGWTVQDWSVGSPVRGIHHPQGDFKRISYGNLVGSSSEYWDVRWEEGTTEPGSSGSPLLDEDGRRFIGQLYGGWASCEDMDELDFYGRFDRAWPQVSRWLDPPAPRVISGDYSGDGKSEFAVFRPATGLWAIRGLTRFYFGRDGDFPVSADYTGDGTADPAVFRPATGLWAVRGLTRFYFGGSGDLPVPGDYRGDGTARPGVFRESTGLWAIRGLTRVYFGSSGDIPVPGDYTGDGTESVAVFRPSTGLWAARGLTRVYHGRQGDIPVPGDYDSSGRLRPAIFRPDSGLWAVRNLTRLHYGTSSDLPVPADYTGTGTDRIGIFRDTSGLWAVRALTRLYYGTSGDLPVAR